MPVEQLRANGSLLNEFVEAVPGAVYAKDREGRILLGNEAFAEAVGWPSGGFVGKNDLELLADKELARAIMENDQRIMATRSRTQLEEVLRSDDGRTTYWLSTKAPFKDEEGNVAGIFGVSIDITERKRLEERERLCAREIEHRNKNLLGVVQSVLRLTRAETVDEFREVVSGRLRVLERVQGVLTREHRQQVELRELLHDELVSYGTNIPGRVQLTGPAVGVTGEAAQPLALAFHELATNAAKYGAFADGSGMLEVHWGMDSRSEPELVIEWKESGGPPVKAPPRKGFGTKLIRAVVERQLHGSVSTEWQPNGVRYAMSLPLQRIVPNGETP